MAWVGSLKTWAEVHVRGFVSVVTCDGSMTVVWNETRQRSAWGAEFSVQPGWTLPDWWFSFYDLSFQGGKFSTFWTIPLWPFILLTGVPGLWMLAKSRKPPGANLCPACHYDRAGLAPNATCPECGKSSDASTSLR